MSTTRQVAEQVYLATDTGKVMTEMGLTPPASAYKSFSVMGKTFDPAKPDDYLAELQDQEGVVRDDAHILRRRPGERRRPQHEVRSGASLSRGPPLARWVPVLRHVTSLCSVPHRARDTGGKRGVR